MLIFRSGNVRATDESRIFCVALAVAERVMPMLLNVVPHDTDDVLVLCVIVVGLYIEFRLSFSYDVDA
jgi:hypothetical protein